MGLPQGNGGVRERACEAAGMGRGKWGPPAKTEYPGDKKRLNHGCDRALGGQLGELSHQDRRLGGQLGELSHQDGPLGALPGINERTAR